MFAVPVCSRRRFSDNNEITYRLNGKAKRTFKNSNFYKETANLLNGNSRVVTVLVDGKQDVAKVVKVVGVADEQNSDGQTCWKRLNDKHIEKKRMEAAIQRRLWDPEIKSAFQDKTLRA
ncbi:hypothetical protein Tco_1478032, partial [Tanacetum coccineum]